MKAHKITLVFIDHDGIGAEEAASVLENNRYPNRCMAPEVLEVQTVDIGEWSDDHPLNKNATATGEWRKLFQAAPKTELREPGVLATREFWIVESADTGQLMQTSWKEPTDWISDNPAFRVSRWIEAPKAPRAPNPPGDGPTPSNPDLADLLSGATHYCPSMGASLIVAKERCEYCNPPVTEGERAPARDGGDHGA